MVSVISFSGKELGARSGNPRCYVDGKVRFDLLAKESGFQGGLEKVRGFIGQHRTALMCAERDPVKCHRAILICRHLRSPDLSIRHIHVNDESIEYNTELEQRLLGIFKIKPDLIRDERQCIEEAYDRQGEKIAHWEEER